MLSTFVPDLELKTDLNLFLHFKTINLKTVPMNSNVTIISFSPEDYNTNFRIEEQLHCFLEMNRPDLAAKLFDKDVKFPGGQGKWAAMLWLEENFMKLEKVTKNRGAFENYQKPEPVQLVDNNGMYDLFYSTRENCGNRVLFFQDSEFPLIANERRPRGLSFKLNNGMVTEIFVVFDFINYARIQKTIKEN